jgi:predicted enzyme related to lactoylglutathione lyase
MKPTGFVVNVTSDQPHRLVEFYRDVVELPPNPQIGDEAFLVGEGSSFVVDGHSETHGMAKEPQRWLISYFVEDVEAEQARLKAKGVSFVRELGVEWWGGIISTFSDPDGNYCQIIQFDPSKATENPDAKATAEATA